MTMVRQLRLAPLGLALAISLPFAGCTDDDGKPGAPGAKASAATEAGGGVTSDSPGGGNVRPNEGTKDGVR